MSQLPALIERTPVPRPTESHDGPVVRIQKMIFAEAVARGASDIHIEPSRESTKVRCRIDGQLRETMEVPRWMHDNLAVRIKILAQLDIAERRVPQDGHISGENDIRVSTLPTRWGEKIVLRVLRRDRAVRNISELGLPPDGEE